MELIYFITEDTLPLARHHHCCLWGYETVGPAGGAHFGIAMPMKSCAREHLRGEIKIVLPSASNTRTLTSAEAAALAALDPAWGVTALDTMRDVIGKAFAATGRHWLDPDI